MRVVFFCLLVLLTVLVGADTTSCQTKTSWNIAFLEGGEYPTHGQLRRHFSDQLAEMLPPGYRALSVPHGFKSAEWDREKCRQMAADLTADKSIDMVVALGPWTVEDLLAAGFDRPIIAAFRYDPLIEGIVDKGGRPVVDNLTVRIRRRKMAYDLDDIATLVDVKKLGVLYFPTGDETDKFLDKVNLYAGALGFKVVTAEGYDRNGTFAFFRAYQALDKEIDALYLPPLWGCTAEKTRQLYSQILRDGIQAFSSEGEFHVRRGAWGGGSGERPEVTARIHAWKAAQIITGALPADLPVVIDEQPGRWVNQHAFAATGTEMSPYLWMSANIVESLPTQDVERVTLAEAVDRALTQNPGYQTKYKALEAAVQAAGEAKAAYFPHVNAEGSISYFDNNTVHNDDRYENERYRASINLEQTLLSLGTIRNIQQTRLMRDQAELDQAQASLDLELAVSIAFFDYLKAVQFRLTQVTYFRNTELAFQMARVRKTLRDDVPGDDYRWEDEYLKALRAVGDANARLEIAGIVLNTLQGRPGELPFFLDDRHFTDEAVMRGQSRFLLLTSDNESRERLANFLVEAVGKSNPRMQEADLAVDQRRNFLSGNSARFLPELGLYASFGLVDERNNTVDFEEEHSVWSVGTRLELPLFNGGQRFKERGRLKAELTGAQYQKDHVRLELANRVRSQLTRVLNQASRFAPAARSSKLSGEYAKTVLGQYATGNRTIAETLDAVRNDCQTTMEYIATQIDYFGEIARLLHDVGWSPHESSLHPDEELFNRLSVLRTTGN